MALEALPDKKWIASTDQKLAYANVLAILAVGQQLSRVNDEARPLPCPDETADTRLP